MTSRSPRPEQGVLAGLLIVAALALADTQVGFDFSGTYAIGALVTSILSPARHTAAVGGLAVALALLSGVWLDGVGTTEWLVRSLLCAVLGLLALASALIRDRREGQLIRLTVIAETAQRAVLRSMPAAVGPVGLAARYVSASTDAAVGGDLYEVATTPFGVRLIVGDVRGKGLEGVQNAATVLVAFRQAAFSEPDLARLARTVDEAVTRLIGEEDFVTAVFAELGPDSVSLVNCGHHPPLLVAEGAARPLETGEPTTPLGLAPEPVAGHHPWPPGSRLLLFTDGLVEARDRRGDFFPLDDHATALADGPLDDALERLLEALRGFAGRHLADDIALVLAENQHKRAAVRVVAGS